MGVIDVENLLSDLSPEAPCGEDLEYDPAFIELGQAILGKTEQQVGDQIIPAEDPNWSQVKSLAIDLTGRTRDLRVAVNLLVAMLRLHGPEGLCDGLAYLRGLIEKQWEHVHPQLDPEDDNDPTMRVNAMVALAAAPGTFGDPIQFASRVHEMPLCDSKQIGRFSYRDIQVASGEVTFKGGEDKQPPDMALIDAAFEDTDIEYLQSAARYISESVEHGEAIEQMLTENVGIQNAADLSAFRKVLTEVHGVIEQCLAKRGYSSGTDLSGEDQAGEGVDEGAGQRISGEIATTQDVLLALDKVCKYYERYEPSSPVPLLLKRAQRLVSKSFVDIIRDLSPDALHQVQVISGTDSEQDSG